MTAPVDKIETMLPSASPEYTLRRSPRARHVRLRITPADGLIVVVPLRFDTTQVPALLDANRGWIARQFATLATIEHDTTPPNEIHLKAVGTTWPVDYRATRSARVAARQHGPALRLSGAVDDHAKCRAALRRWLARQAKRHLVPWLQKLSGMHNLPFQEVTVRGQKTRWASCSSRHTISINYELLFLDAKLVNYVLLHELCHTRQLNHGPAFWALLQRFEPEYRQLHQSLRRQKIHGVERRVTQPSAL
jgi:predicted metal-dependent hydrolase